jgi:hypothetical protein
MLKLKPFEEWVKPWLAAGDQVFSYVAIRADEEYRDGYSAKANNLFVRLPFREAGIDKPGVIDILESSGVGYPKYYEWRSRSGCTFCFFQQKIEWVRLKEQHPDDYEKAKELEKDALEHGSPFTWSKDESLWDMEKPERIAEIKAEYEIRRARLRKSIPINPLRPIKECSDDIDDIYGVDEGGGACVVCHK